MVSGLGGAIDQVVDANDLCIPKRFFELSNFLRHFELETSVYDKLLIENMQLSKRDKSLIVIPHAAEKTVRKLRAKGKNK